MKKKGFTLIEMLAVLVILAVIALIVIPTITLVIKTVKKAAFKSSVNHIIASADNYIGEHVITNHEDLLYPVTIICDGNTCEDINGTKLTFKGPVPISGKIILENAGNIRADLVSNGEWCASGLKGRLEVYEDCTLLDHTNPEIDESKLNDVLISTTTNTLTVAVPDGLMYDNETGIAGYNVELYLNDTKVDSKAYNDPHIIFTNLKSDTEYKVVIIGTNGNGGKTSVDKYGTTLDITKPTITYTNDPTTAVGGYFKSQTLNVSYTVGDIVSPSYYIRSGRDASTNIDVIASCGTGDEPSSCTSMTSTSIGANTWYQVSGNLNVIYNTTATTETYLTALIYDGTNYDGADTKTVAKIDATAPTAPTISYNSGSNDCMWENNINITLASSAITGIDHYEIDWDGDDVVDTTTGANFIPWNGWHSHNTRFRAVSGVGIAGAWSNSVHVHMDTQAPGTTTISYNSGNGQCVWQNNINISLSASDNTGIAYYEIDYNSDGVADTTTGANFVPGSGWSSCDNKFRAVDHAGNRGAWSSSVHIHQDTTNPTHTEWWWGEVNTSVARLYVRLTDNVGVPDGGTINVSLYNGHNVGVYCPTSTASGGNSNWVWFRGVWDASASAYRCDITPGTFGHYGQAYLTHLYIWDYAGNGGYYNQTSVAIPSNCSYAANQTVFAVEAAGAYSYTVPAGCSGTYTLQAYGAQGGQVHISPGGAGGYAYGNMRITAVTTIYIYVGGQGPTCGVSAAAYNGGTGGSGSCDFSRTGDEIVGGGGGATHMATVNRGELKNYNSYRNEVIIVAGGGGGGYGYKGWNSDGGYERNTAGGTGGGTAGGSTSGSGYGFGIGGSQSAAGGSGGFGYGSANGGGGGWFGGGQAGNAGAAGGGGSGYLNTSYLISGTTGMANGQKAGAGAAYITFRSAG